MNKTKTFLSIAGALAAGQATRMLTQMDMNDALSVLGLERHRSRTLENIGLIVLGALAGSGAALLLAPNSGRDTREKLTEKLQEFGSSVAELETNAASAFEKYRDQVTHPSNAQT